MASTHYCNYGDKCLKRNSQSQNTSSHVVLSEMNAEQSVALLECNHNTLTSLTIPKG